MKALPRSCLPMKQYQQLFPPSSSRIIIFDVETTGLDSRYHEVIEIGAIELIENEETRRFHEYACPTRPISKAVTDVHGLTLESLEGEQDSLTIVGRFIKWIGDTNEAYIVGHNIKFDISFLDAALKVYNRINNENLQIPRKTICTLDLMKLAFRRDASLDQACKIFEIKDLKNRKQHGAMIDAELTMKLYFCMRECKFFADTAGIASRKIGGKKAIKNNERVLPWENGVKKQKCDEVEVIDDKNINID